MVNTFSTRHLFFCSEEFLNIAVMKPAELRKRIKNWSIARRFNYLAYNLLHVALIGIILSFTPLSLDGAYIGVILADITISWMVYDLIITPGKKNTSGISTENKTV